MLRSMMLERLPTGRPVGVVNGLALTVTRPGTTAIALPGSGMIACIGAPKTTSPSGSARAPAAGVPSFRPQRVVWKPVPLTWSLVPASNTSCWRHMYHMPIAKCG